MSSIFIPPSHDPSQARAAWQKAANHLLQEAEDYRIWCFHGDLGAGKTTCIQALCHTLGVAETVTSPTFGLMHAYHASQGKTIYHFDFYRLKNKEEAVDIGCEEYFNSGAYCFIEWPAVASSLLPNLHLDLFLSMEKEGGRKVKVLPCS